MLYKFYLKNVEKAHQYEELMKVFLKPEEFIILMDNVDENSQRVMSYCEGKTLNADEKYYELELNEELGVDRNILKKEIFEILTKETGMEIPWGTITGIRPVKLFGETVKSLGGEENAIRVTERIFREYYCVSEEKTKLTSDMYKYQMESFGEADEKSVGLYIGIPFCPTRCLYCSFTSNQAKDGEIEKYLEALHKEIEFVSQQMKETGMYAESIYIGGGTPTTLEAEDLKELIEHVNRGFKTDKLKEFTVEAGRPDTITAEKLQAIKEAGVDRISINPQTMHDKTLNLIGRDHDVAQIVESFRLAQKVGIENINADLIAGLPGESFEDFVYSLDKVLELNPTNITVHTLAVKRTSRLAGIDDEYHYNQGFITQEMLDYAYEKLGEKGLVPYYMYRQKHMTGAGENTGFCIRGTENIYNARIMDEHQTIVALGAGGISKKYYPEENRLERVPNVTNYQVYIERIDEMLKRKEENLFKEV